MHFASSELNEKQVNILEHKGPFSLPAPSRFWKVFGFICGVIYVTVIIVFSQNAGLNPLNGVLLNVAALVIAFGCGVSAIVGDRYSPSCLTFVLTLLVPTGCGGFFLLHLIGETFGSVSMSTSGLTLLVAVVGQAVYVFVATIYQLSRN